MTNSHFLLDDLDRVLEARRHILPSHPLYGHGAVLERRSKPLILSSFSSTTTPSATRRYTNNNDNTIDSSLDLDGAQRCLAMLRQHTHRDSTTNHDTTITPPAVLESAYQLVMRAFLQRGRLRWWRRSNNNNNYDNSSDNHSRGQTGEEEEEDSDDKGRSRLMDKSDSKSSGISKGITKKSSSTAGSSTIICAADQLEEMLLELEQALQQQQSQKSQHDSASENSIRNNAYHPLNSTNINANGCMIQQQDGSGSRSRCCSVETYNLVLAAYAICATPRGDRQYAVRAHSLLRDMEEQQIPLPQSFVPGADNDKVPKEVSVPSLPVESYLHVLHAYAWQQANLQSPAGGADPAAEILLRICEIAAPNDVETRLQAHIWALEAYSKSLGGAPKCQALLETIVEWNSTLTENDSLKSRQLLDAQVYSNVVLAWSKDTNIEGSAIQAHVILLQLIQGYFAGSFAIAVEGSSEPPLIAFNGVISAWSRIGRLDKAEEVLWLMEKDLRPHCNSLIPNAVSYNSILHGILLRMPNREMALDKALEIVGYMETHAESQPAIQPNAFTYDTLLKCWLQSSRVNAVQEAEELLIRMEQLWSQGDDSIDPNNRIYNKVLNAFAKRYSGRVVSSKALDLLQRMKASSQCQPDIITYTSAIECIAKSSEAMAPRLTEELFDEATALYEQTKDAALMPNLRFYTMAIQSLAKHNGSAVRARELLTQLIEQYFASGKDPRLLPNTYPYNYVLNCAANAIDNKLEAFQIASQTYQEMRKSEIVKPDSFSYAFWLKCCNNLLEAGDLRTKGITYAFEECKREGLVNHEVLTRLLQGSPLVLVDRMLETSTTAIGAGSSETLSGRNDIYENDYSISDTVATQNSVSFLSTGSSLQRRKQQRHRSLNVQDLPPSWSRNTHGA